MGKVKKSKSKSKPAKTGKVKGAVKSAASAIGARLTGGAKRGGGGVRRRRGPEYWAKKVLVERLKKRYWKVKYGGR